VGIAIVILPDKNLSPLFELASGHGPSWLDSIGLFIAIISWFVLLVEVWKSRNKVLGSLGLRRIFMLAFFTGLGIGLIIASLWNFPTWWLVGATVSFLSQLFFILPAFKK
jgi:hypothetical protein